MNVLDLFSGIGGFSLGLERAGMKTVAFCEIAEYPRRILKKHWPEVPIYDDVRKVTAAQLRTDGVIPDLICGGFPCQDISNAGNREGIDGEQSGLWREYFRIIRELVEAGSPPKWVTIENVSALRGRGLGRVLSDIASIGYDAEWHCIPASAIGAHHQRDRIWIIAYPHHDEGRGIDSQRGPDRRDSDASGDGEGRRLADTPGARLERLLHGLRKNAFEQSTAERNGQAVSDTVRSGRERPSERGPVCQDKPGRSAENENISDAESGRRAMRGRAPGEDGHPLWSDEAGIGTCWLTEPDLGRVADGVPDRVDRLTALGNAVVPQIPELIGLAIMEIEAERRGKKE